MQSKGKQHAIPINTVSTNSRCYKWMQLQRCILRAQQSQINQCLQTLSHAEYSDCINQSNKSYDEYSLERKEVIDK